MLPDVITWHLDESFSPLLGPPTGTILDYVYMQKVPVTHTHSLFDLMLLPYSHVLFSIRTSQISSGIMGLLSFLVYYLGSFINSFLNPLVWAPLSVLCKDEFLSHLQP